MTKAKSIIELLIVAMIMLCGALVRTFFTSSPAHALEVGSTFYSQREVFTHMEYSIKA
jgi:hypothetical protein